ncbi:hypothetical protein CC2G_012289 [Coprinopsis cinerea AmutBmut pab1-1]|nr:hypothetical protein CC2G_012289 [Coprinopsis cinerea AmutBmut pab1-1]
MPGPTTIPLCSTSKLLLGTLGGISTAAAFHLYQKSQSSGRVIPGIPILDNTSVPRKSRDETSTIYQTVANDTALIVISGLDTIPHLYSQSSPVHTSLLHLENYKALTSCDNAERALEVLDEAWVPILLEAASESSQHSLHRRLQVDAEFSSLFRNIGIKALRLSQPSNQPLSDFVFHSVFRATASAFLGPTYPIETSSDYLTILKSHPVPTSSSFKSPSGLELERARLGVMKSLVQYLEEWWYLDGYGDIEGASPLLLKLLRVAKEEELGVDEAAANLLFILYHIILPSWTASTRILSRHLHMGQPRPSLLDQTILASWIDDTLATLHPGYYGPLPARSLGSCVSVAVGEKEYNLPPGTLVIDSSALPCNDSTVSSSLLEKGVATRPSEHGATFELVRTVVRAVISNYPSTLICL